MNAELQKASITKRIAAAILDFIVITILVTGVAAVLSSVLDFNSHIALLDERQKHYEAEYNVKFDISQEDFEKLTQEELKTYDTAYSALVGDDAFLQAISVTMSIITFSVMIGMFISEFCVPLWLKNGQTIGKKIFGLALIRVDGVQLTTFQLFVRSVLGKFTVETMIPIYILIMIFFNTASIIHLAILAILLIGQVASVIISKTDAAIHDHFAGTVVVDFASQMIFHSKEDLLAYTKKIHAERANRSDYK